MSLSTECWPIDSNLRLQNSSFSITFTTIIFSSLYRTWWICHLSRQENESKKKKEKKKKSPYMKAEFISMESQHKKNGFSLINQGLTKSWSTIVGVIIMHDNSKRLLHTGIIMSLTFWNTVDRRFLKTALIFFSRQCHKAIQW